MQAFLKSSDKSISFSNRLNAGARREVHELAEKYGLIHASMGEGDERYVVIWKDAAAAQEDISKRFKDMVSQKVAAGLNANTAAVECIKYFKEAMARLEHIAKQAQEPSKSGAGSNDNKMQGKHLTFSSIKDHKKANVVVAKDQTTSVTLKAAERDPSASVNDSTNSRTSVQTVEGTKGDRDDHEGNRKKLESSRKNDNTRAASQKPEGIPEQVAKQDPLSAELEAVRSLQAERHKASRARELKEWVGEQPGARTSQGKKSRSKKGKKSKSKAKSKSHQAKPEVGELASKEVLSRYAGDDQDDEMALLNSLVSAKSTCAHKDCKKNNRYGDTCRHCKFRFCQEHALPELHGCGAAAKTQARSTPWISSGGVLHGTSSMSSDKRQQLRQKLGKRIGSEKDKRKSKTKSKRDAK